jgi:hypothetical protein
LHPVLPPRPLSGSLLQPAKVTAHHPTIHMLSYSRRHHQHQTYTIMMNT